MKVLTGEVCAGVCKSAVDAAIVSCNTQDMKSIGAMCEPCMLSMINGMAAGCLTDGVAEAGKACDATCKPIIVDALPKCKDVVLPGTNKTDMEAKLGELRKATDACPSASASSAWFVAPGFTALVLSSIAFLM